MKDDIAILIADEHETSLRSTARLLTREGYVCDCAHDASEALASLRGGKYDILVADTRMPGNGELEFVRRVRTKYSHMPVIVLTGHPSLATAIESLRLSVIDYLLKPLDISQLCEAIQLALSRRRVLSRQDFHGPSLSSDSKINRTAKQRDPSRDKNSDLTKHLAAPMIPKKTVKYSFDNIIGESQVMKDLFARMIKIAQCDSNVLIYGESGTGKELIARTIHEHSARNANAFIPVDTVALPANLLESQLFGYEKGAFTGAQAMRRGLFEFADQGTLLLDEIAELDLYLQAKLLRVIQEREFRRLGGKELVKVDFRIIAATNKEPQEAVNSGLFREDLFYRLNVIPLHLPPLRERKEDIRLLVDYYLKKFEKFSKLSKRTIDAEAKEAMKNYWWPGNVRQLVNVVEQLVAMTDASQICHSDLPDDILNSGNNDNHEVDKRFELPYAESKHLVLREFDTAYFEKLLDKCRGNISEAARIARVDRKTLYRKIGKL